MRLITPRSVSCHPRGAMRFRVFGIWCTGLIAVFNSTIRHAVAQGVTDIIAMSGTPAPGNGMLDVLYLPVLNNAGQAAFAADLSGTNFGTADDRAIYRSQGGPLVQIARDFSSLGALVIADTSYATNLSGVAMNDAGQVVYRAGRAPIFGSLDDVIERSDGTNVATIARTGQSAPDGNGTFSSFYTTNLNASGEVAFLSSLTGTSEDQGRFRGSGGPVTQIARIGQSAPDGNGTFSSFGYSHLNASGQTAFDAYLAGTGGTGNSGVFRGAGGSITQIARAGQPAPDGNGVFSLVQMRGLDASGQVAFHAQLAGTRGGSSDDRGIYRGSGAAISQIARGAQPAPDGNGVFDFFSTTAFNTSGQAAFLGFLTHTRGGVGDNEGIFGSIDGAIRQFARKGQPAPDGNGTFFGFRLFDFNAAGQAGFSAALAGTSDGNTNNAGLFLANGIDVIEVARTGEGLANSTIAALFVSENIIGHERSGLNDAGQAAYLATLSNGSQVIARYTIPQIHWTNSASGSWTTDGNWTQGIEPNSFHDTLIDPATSLTVTAPTTNKTVKSLVLGGGGSGVATLRLSGFGTGDLRALDATTITPNGELVLENGRTLSASLLANGGVIHGTGTIHAPVVNERSGQIRVGSGERLVLTGVGNANDGLIQVIGGEIEFTESLTNAVSTGLITARNATLRFGGGLTNKGNLGISFGTSDVNGEIENIGGITISGGSSATFYDDVTNRGTINVSAGSTAVFFGELSGSGVSGSGTVYLEGDARPGFSPGTMAFGGDLWFGPLATLEIEIGGPTPGTQSDRLIVANSVSLAGTLDATTINGFAPTLPGQSFTIITAGSLSGMFHAVAGQPSRTLPGMFWDVTYTPTSALLFTSAIPGDINLDGDVDRTDAALFSQYFGMKTGSIWTTGDFNGDAATTLNDWVLLRTHLGQSVPSPLESRAAAGVPEPAASWLAVLALTLVTLRRRR